MQPCLGEPGPKYRGFTLVLTFLFYTAYHLSRKPISIVKWDVRERLPLRLYLSAGMLLSGLFTALFGLGFYWNIHSLTYYGFIQVMNGLVQTTGWPAVVACVGNWCGKGNVQHVCVFVGQARFIMGVWNSHTSVGNILGSLIAGAFVSSAWGLSFIVPGAIIAGTGIICFFFLVDKPEDVGCSPPVQHGDGSEVVEAGSEHSEEEEAIGFCAALKIPGVLEFSFCLLFAKLVSYTFLFWLPLYISNVAHFDPKAAGDMSTLFDVGGIVGGILAGLVSDYTGARASTCWVMLVTAAPMLFVYNSVGQQSLGTAVGLLLLCGALVNGPYALITTAVSADLVRTFCCVLMFVMCVCLGTHESLRGNSRALSTVTAIIDGPALWYALLWDLSGRIISPSGWNNVFYMLISADVLACLLLSRLVYKELRGCCGRRRG
ncbi:hypothetical protein WMY93_015669 [Mugilogobius chulae]|uniref:Glucose-6-phosphate exchanger SLC37A2 n=1 Tax=Mugilogobius chulae TaxID=88201 RepID=A0AAW0NTC5_9GOBI